MTRFEAESELSGLTVLETAAWQEVMTVDQAYQLKLSKLESERLVAKDEADQHGLTARQVWLPLHKRRRELEVYLSVSKP